MPVAEGAPAPPGPIPNPVVTRRSAGEYCGGDPAGGEAAAGAPAPHLTAFGRPAGGWGVRRNRIVAVGVRDAGWSSGSSLGS